MASENGPRKGRRDPWVLSLVSRFGTTEESGFPGVHKFRIRGPLAAHLGREEILLTFQKRLAARDGVEFAAPGGWLHDQLLGFAAGWGRATAFYLPDLDPDRDEVLRRRRIPVSRQRLEERRYLVHLEFTFRLQFYTDPPRESLLTLVYDQERRRLLKRGYPRRLLDDAAAEGDPAFLPGPDPDPVAAFPAVWDRVEDSVEDEVRVWQQTGQERQVEELAKVESYYRQLIEEEKNLLKSRTSARTREEGERRLDLLKLEWERRVKEETDRLEPQVVAAVTALAVVYAPAERWSLAPVNGSGAVSVWIDLARGDAWQVRAGGAEPAAAAEPGGDGSSPPEDALPGEAPDPSAID